MTIFGNSRLGRIGYAIVLLLMFAFDFAKGPIEHYVVKLHDDTARELMQPHIVKKDHPTNAGTINGVPMPFMLKSQEDAIRAIVESKQKLSRAEIRARLEAAARNTDTTFTPNYPVDPEINTLAETRSFYEALYPVAVIVMTGITIVGLLWMVPSRLRDIGWPQYFLWILIAPVFLPKFIHIPLPALAEQGIGLLFWIGIFALVFIPGEYAGRTPPTIPVRTQPIEIKNQQGRFGRLGTG